MESLSPSFSTLNTTLVMPLISEPPQFDDASAWTVDHSLPARGVWDRIVKYHVMPCMDLFHAHGVGLVPSVGSCYRSVAHEISKGRPGTSLHCFPVGTRGACDLVRADRVDMATVIDLLVEQGPWRRICWYPVQRFVHVDYGDHKGQPVARRQLFEAPHIHGSWSFRSFLPEITK